MLCTGRLFEKRREAFMNFMMVKHKRWLSLLLSVAMLVSVMTSFTITAWAEDHNLADVVNQDDSGLTVVVKFKNSSGEYVSLEDMGGKVSTDGELQLTVDFSLANDSVINAGDTLVYYLPEGIDTSGIPPVIMRGNIQIGTTEFGVDENGNATIKFHFNDSFINESNRVGSATFDLKLKAGAFPEEEQHTYEFPASTNQDIEVTYAKEVSSSQKSSDFSENTEGYVIYNVSFTPKANYKEVTIHDVLGDNLEYYSDIDGFEWSDANVWAASWNPVNPEDITITDNSADVTLHDVEYGKTYTIRYKVKTKDPFLDDENAWDGAPVKTIRILRHLQSMTSRRIPKRSR